MRLLTILFFVTIVMASCSRRSSIPMSDTSKTYEGFRAEQKVFASDDGDIHYVDQGKGPVILLLHGVPSSSWLYRKMIDGLVQEGHRVIAPDMLGFGSSDNPQAYKVYSEENHGKRLLALMDHAGVESWTHVLHDAGGLWTWEMLEQDPSKVDHLVILNTIIYEDGFAPPIRMKPGIIAKISMWAYHNGITTNMLLKQLFKMGLKKDELTKAEVNGYRTPLIEKKTDGMYYFFTQTKKALPDYRQLLKSLEIPTMVVWGSDDEMLLWTPQADEVQKDLRISSDDIHIIDGKHFIQEERPEEINKLILDFIRK